MELCLSLSLYDRCSYNITHAMSCRCALPFYVGSFYNQSQSCFVFNTHTRILDTKGYKNSL